MEAVSDDALERTIQIGQQGFQGKTTWLWPNKVKTEA